MMRFVFNERKAAQAASILLERAGGSMDYLKLVKLLYLADRAALIETEGPITDDHYASMKHGPTPCQVLELILQEHPAEDSIWHRTVKRQYFDVFLCGPVESEQLSQANVDLLNDTYETYGRLHLWQIAAVTGGQPNPGPTRVARSGRFSHPDRPDRHPALRRLQRVRDRVGDRQRRGCLPISRVSSASLVNPGDTFFGFDKRGHLWMVLTEENANGDVAVANFTTHDAVSRRTCSADCLVVQPGEQPYPRHETCVIYERATLTGNAALQRGADEGVYDPQAPLTRELLERIREGALNSEAPEAVKAAIRRDRQ